MLSRKATVIVAAILFIMAFMKGFEGSFGKLFFCSVFGSLLLIKLDNLLQLPFRFFTKEHFFHFILLSIALTTLFLKYFYSYPFSTLVFALAFLAVSFIGEMAKQS